MKGEAVIKLPVKDPDTVPWMSKREIPAIKAVLSAWRNLRKDKASVRHAKMMVDSLFEKGNVQLGIDNHLRFVATDLEELAAIDERLWKEARDAKAKA